MVDEAEALGNEPSRDTLVHPATWRLVTLVAPNPDDANDVFEIRTLRPLALVEHYRLEPGVWTPLAIDEFGWQGMAQVVSIEECPPIDAGPGRVVLSTFVHTTNDLYELSLEGRDEPIGVTGEHPFYSENRESWVAARELAVGEYLRTLSGPLAVERIEATPGRHRVYNLEIEGAHRYHVTELGVLCHNVKACWRGVQGLYRIRVLVGGKWKWYVGRSKDIYRRLMEHIRSGKVTPGGANNAQVLPKPRATPRGLRNGEQGLIDDLGGPNSAKCANRRNEVAQGG